MKAPYTHSLKISARHKAAWFGKELTMSRIETVLLLIGLLGAILVLPVLSIASPTQTLNLQDCAEGGMSTEEDFMADSGHLANPYVSDGDLLSLNGQVCARNADLLQVFYSGSQAPADLGLDAVDILDVSRGIVALSTELDDPEGQFAAGDLLLTNGTVIPNTALVYTFHITYDIGLDGVHFVGALDDIKSFAEFAPSLSPEEWTQGGLQDELNNFDIDIWFTIEEWHPDDDGPDILEGDMLSALGGVVTSQADLLPAAVPAGLPMRGVDFGLDAITGPRLPGQEPFMQFSTEIPYTDAPQFTDGDVLLLGNGVLIPNQNVILPFLPAADFLGLDALYSGAQPPHGCVNRITDVGGLSVDVADINVFGRAEIGLLTDHPFGANVPFWGTICDDLERFRVVFRRFADGPGAGTGIPVQLAEGWVVHDRNPITGACTTDVPWFSDADGWFDAASYRDLLDCNPNLILTNWKSANAPDANELYRVWLEFDRGAGVESEPTPHPVRLDNESPDINNLAIPGGACTVYHSTDMPIMVQGDVFDDHFWGYRLSIAGAAYPRHYYSRINYTSGVLDLSPTGTDPSGGLVDLHEVSVSHLVTPPDIPVACAYGVRLEAWDRTINGSFDPAFNLVGGSFRGEVSREIFFDYTP